MLWCSRLASTKMCKTCEIKAVIKISDRQLCKSCFVKYFERKIVKTVHNYKLIQKGDKIGVACSGGKDSMSLLYFLNKFVKQRKNLNIKIIPITIVEGIKGYRASERELVHLIKFCKENKLPLKIYYFKKEFGYTLDDMCKRLKQKPCTICGVLRRYLLNKMANKLKLDKLATAHNLDDEAQSILMNQFRKNIRASAILGPMTGIVAHKKFVRRIKPLYFITEKEVMIYAFLKNLLSKYKECPYEDESYRVAVRDMLNSFEARFPGTKYAIISSFLEILPLLKEHCKGEIKLCSSCKEPSSQDVCRACKILAELKINRYPFK